MSAIDRSISLQAHGGAMAAFYKTNHPEVMAACATIRAETAALEAAGEAFGKSFVGRPFYLRHHQVYFGGLIFAPIRDRVLWTAPGRYGEQWPRAKPGSGATKAQRDEHKALSEKWAAEYPKGRPNFDSLYKAIGTDWCGAMLCGIGYVELDGWLYVSTGAKLNDRMSEILGSEYAAAIGGAK